MTWESPVYPGEWGIAPPLKYLLEKAYEGVGKGVGEEQHEVESVPGSEALVGGPLHPDLGLYSECVERAVVTNKKIG